MACILAAQSMIFGLAVNLHPEMSILARQAVQGGILAATLIVLALLGPPLARASLRELTAGRITMELLFLTTMIGAMCASLQAHLTGHGSVYYEVISILLIVYTVGKTLSAHGRERAARSSRLWASDWDTCRVIRPDSPTACIIPVGDIVVGDTVEVYPGEAIPIDGQVTRGVGHITQSVITGEPFPVIKRPGDSISAGCFSHDATFRIEATSTGTQRHIDHLLTIVDQARNTPLSLQSSADRIGVVFLPVVLLIAGGTFLSWFIHDNGHWDHALFNAMAVLLTACPCVIGLATPIVVWMTVGRLAEGGVILRSADAIERLATVDHVVFDKTGTLTEDQYTLCDIVVSDSISRSWLLGILSCIESQSHHPVARAFTALPQPFAIQDIPDVLESHTVPGSGITAVITQANAVQHTFRIGTVEWISGGNRTNTDTLNALATGLIDTFGHRVAVEMDGIPVAVASVAERLRASAGDTLADFARLGISAEILTGDVPGRAESLGLQNVTSGQLPDDKFNRVQALRELGRKPLMIGDGVNDSSALATAHVSVSLSSGTDLANHAADITLYHDDLRAIPWAVQTCRYAMYVARRNMIFALCYNVIGMSLAASGFLHPLAAVLLMSLSSLTLIFASMRVGSQVAHCEVPDINPVSQIENPTHSFCLAYSSIAHAVAVPLQGIILSQMMGLPTPLTISLTCATAALGLLLARAWYYRHNLRHHTDMVFGMLTVGNLGMVLGWWADSDFSVASAHGCCHCADPNWQHPWMWAGMLIFSNVSMYCMNRNPLPTGSHAFAMLSGGNLGMILGMWAGGSAASSLSILDVPSAILSHYGAMTIGMTLGMLVGTWLLELLTDAVLSAWRS